MNPAEYLDQLDQARAKATPGPWGKAWSNHLVDLDVHPDDAALIVAAVNALPKLTAALRAVLDRAEELDEDARDAKRLADRAPDKELYRISIRHARVAKHASDSIRAAITDALDGSE